MRCIFCKRNTALARAVEHIIPESLGNTKLLLPRGVVCESCNNYFSREVEKPFLQIPAVLDLRFHQAIPSKRGIIPPAFGVITPGFPAIVHKHTKGPLIGHVTVPPEGLSQILRRRKGSILFPATPDIPDGPTVSRFLAKVAVELCAQRLLNYPEYLDQMIDFEGLDPIRKHARQGVIRDWPFSKRYIYDPDRLWIDEAGTTVQTLHETDVLLTEHQEWYSVIAIFGLEFAINLGGPEIGGYLQWLEMHDGISPLYHGKNVISRTQSHAAPGTSR